MFGDTQNQAAPQATEPPHTQGMTGGLPPTPAPSGDLTAAASSLTAAASSYEMVNTKAATVTPPADMTDDTAASTPSAPSAPALNETDQTDLLSIKKEVLTQLTPLMDQLDQSPEEKFKTTMMLLQSTDDHKLIKSAYDAALMMTDEKSKAQALLDIVNEINYFTHTQN